MADSKKKKSVKEPKAKKEVKDNSAVVAEKKDNKNNKEKAFEKNKKDESKFKMTKILKKKSKESEDEEKDVKKQKKTKGEVQKELREKVEKETKNLSRKEKNKALKAAQRDAKKKRKKANYVEEKGKKLSNGVLAIMIFGTVFVMFAAAWGYNYYHKDESIQKYMKNNGGTAAYSNVQIDENKTAKVAAKGNDMKIVVTDTSSNKKKEIKYFKTKKGQEELEYISAYFLAMTKPNTRGFTASAKCAVKIDGKKITTVEIGYSKVKKILKKKGLTIDDIQKMSKQAQTNTGVTDSNGNPVDIDENGTPITNNSESSNTNE